MSPKTIRLRSENDQFQHIETLRRNRNKRQKSQEFFVEGVRPINQALAYGWTISSFVYAYDQPLSDWAIDILDRSSARQHIELPFALLQKLSSKEETSELLALIDMPPDDPARIPLRSDPLIVVFDRPASPGNLGTIIRSCDALGVDGLIITGHAVDLYDPETIRATTGSFFAVPVVRLPSQRELTDWLTDVRAQIGAVQLVGTSAKAAVPIWQHDFRPPTVLVIGNETWGLSAAYKELCDQLVTIPISGSATSLNVASAASIMLYEVLRQRRSDP